MRKGYEKIIKRINSISKHDSELLQQFSNYLTIQEADAIYDTIALRYYGIKREITLDDTKNKLNEGENNEIKQNAQIEPVLNEITNYYEIVLNEYKIQIDYINEEFNNNLLTKKQKNDINKSLKEKLSYLIKHSTFISKLILQTDFKLIPLKNDIDITNEQKDIVKIIFNLDFNKYAHITNLIDFNDFIKILEKDHILNISKISKMSKNSENLNNVEYKKIFNLIKKIFSLKYSNNEEYKTNQAEQNTIDEVLNEDISKNKYYALDFNNLMSSNNESNANDANNQDNQNNLNINYDGSYKCERKMIITVILLLKYNSLKDNLFLFQKMYEMYNIQNFLAVKKSNYMSGTYAEILDNFIKSNVQEKAINNKKIEYKNSMKNMFHTTYFSCIHLLVDLILFKNKGIIKLIKSNNNSNDDLNSENIQNVQNIQDIQKNYEIYVEHEIYLYFNPLLYYAEYSFNTLHAIHAYCLLKNIDIYKFINIPIVKDAKTTWSNENLNKIDKFIDKVEKIQIPQTKKYISFNYLVNNDIDFNYVYVNHSNYLKSIENNESNEENDKDDCDDKLLPNIEFISIKKAKNISNCQDNPINKSCFFEFYRNNPGTFKDILKNQLNNNEYKRKLINKYLGTLIKTSFDIQEIYEVLKELEYLTKIELALPLNEAIRTKITSSNGKSLNITSKVQTRESAKAKIYFTNDNHYQLTEDIKFIENNLKDDNNSNNFSNSSKNPKIDLKNYLDVFVENTDDISLVVLDNMLYISKSNSTKRNNGKLHPFNLKDLMYNQNSWLTPLIKDYLKYLAENNVYFAKDILKTDLKHFIIPVSLDELITYNNWNEFFVKKYKDSQLLKKYKFSRHDPIYNYLVIKSLRKIDKESINILQQRKELSTTKIKKLFSNKSNRKVDDILRYFLTYIIIEQIETYNHKDIETLIDIYNENHSYYDEYNGGSGGVWTYSILESEILDYVNMCFKAKIKVNLKVRSINQVINRHDKLSQDIALKSFMKNKEMKVNIPKNSRFNELETILSTDKTHHFEWIKDKKRLAMETIEQHHCVWSYYDLINKDHCAIYSFIFNKDSQRYTIEFHKKNDHKKNEYFVVQIQGKFNRVNTSEARKYVENILQEYYRNQKSKLINH